MPIIKSAKKKMKQDKKRKRSNHVYEKAVERSIEAVKKNKDKKKVKDLIKKAYSTIDKAAKKKVMKRNKANRLKSRVNRYAL